MATKTINAELLAKMFLAGAANLEAKKEFINELNVFPVPDGDTGTNMTLTIMSAAKEVSAMERPDLQRRSGKKKRSIRLYLHRHVSVQEQLLTRRS